MRTLLALLVLLAAPMLVPAQDGPQQPPAPPNNPDVTAEMKALQKQVAALQREIIAPNTPKNAHLSMVYTGIRFVLPTASANLVEVVNPY